MSVVLVKIIDFIYGVFRRNLQSKAFEEDLRTALLNKELRDLSHEEEIHMEKEFEDFDKLYPRE